jgi:hypothetical protein
MSGQNKKALICAFFLAKFGSSGLDKLGYSNWKEAFAGLGKELGVNPNTVKNMRDEFDPCFGQRKGWYQRPLRPSRQALYDMFSEASLAEMLLYVRNCLGPRASSGLQHAFLESTLNALDGNFSYSRAVSSQMETGKKAERLFKERFKRLRPGEGPLEDKTESGCGYDFHAGPPKKRSFYEVKGLKASSGSVRFTEKEWATAKRHKKRYHLAFVTDINRSPKIRLFNNPTRFKHKPSATIVSQVHYIIKPKDFKK